MRKTLSILVALFFMVGVAFAATPGKNQSPGIGDIMGQGKYDSDPHRTFRLVRYAHTQDVLLASDLTADAIVIWETTTWDDGVTVTTTTVSSDSRVAGIIVANALTQETVTNTAVLDIGKRNWTWLQTYGLSQATFGIAHAPVGSAFGCDTIEGAAGAYSHDPPEDVSDATRCGNAGFLMDAVTPYEQDVEVFLKCE